MADGSQVNWQGQLDVEQHWNERFVNTPGTLLEQFVDLETVQGGKFQRIDRRNVIAQGHQIEQRIVLRRRGEPSQYLL
ncbi:MAG: hypothetical protein Q8O52_28480 [Sulfuritalea sp.]|nr:hypothetical protein [Sulfuritalea sp.]